MRIWILRSVFSNKLAANPSLAGIFLACTLAYAPCAAAQAPNAAAPQPAPQAASQSPVASPAAPAPAASASHARSVYRRHSIDDRVKELAKGLDLNETQQAGVKAVLQRQQLQARQIQFDQTLTGGDRIAHFRALQEDTVLRIRALLNDEQKKKYDPILNHAPQSTTPSDSYVDQWMKYHQQPIEQHAQPPQK
ncbi:MAG TPA: hypothetical protein VK466_02395 [Terriglobales bacterium]|nr:hypothetical protein [Terriglobales bacterium]